MAARARRYSRLADRRRAMGLSQEKFAEVLGVDRSTVGRWERGDTEPQPEIRPHIASTLRIDLGKLSELFDTRQSSTPAPEINAVGEPIGDRQISQTKAKISSLLASEKVFGGALLSPIALRASSTFDRRLQVAGARRGYESDAYATAAELYEVTGWFLVDAAEATAVRDANRKAIHYCALAGDRSMEMFVTQNMSMHAVETGNPAEGLTLVRAMLDRDLSPRLGALFRMREARALAALGDFEARKIFAYASSLYQDGVRDNDPRWSWWVDDAQMLVQEACVYSDLAEWEKSILAYRAHHDLASQKNAGFLPIAEHALCMADMAYAMANLGAWVDAEATALELLENAADITPRAYSSIRRLVKMVASSPDSPVSLRDVIYALSLEIGVGR